MEKRRPEAEIADEDLEQVTGGATPTFGAGATALPGSDTTTTSSIMKAPSDTQGVIVGNLKAS